MFNHKSSRKVSAMMLLTLFTVAVRCWFSISNELPPQDAVQKIPKCFHTVWMNFGRGDEPFPEYKANIEKLMRLHPGWEVKNWNEQEIDDLIRTEYPQFYPTYNSYDVKIKKHDFCRAIIMHKFGGIYLDHDSNPLRNIEPILKSYDVVFGNEMPDRFYPINGVLASVPGHDFWIFFLQSMCRPGESRKFVLSATGPWKLSPTMCEYERTHSTEGMKLYSNQFYCPIHCHDKHTGQGKNDDELRAMFPNCYILQQFRSTWK